MTSDRDIPAEAPVPERGSGDRAIAAAAEDWSAWETTSADGFEYAPWDAAPNKVSDRRGAYEVRKRAAAKGKRKK